MRDRDRESQSRPSDDEGISRQRLAHVETSGRRFAGLAAVESMAGGQRGVSPSGKAVPTTAAGLLYRQGKSHVEGGGLATGRVGHVLRDRPVAVRPSMRAQILADDPTTAAVNDMLPGRRSIVAPTLHEDIAVRAAGLPPLRATSRVGFMSGLGSVAVHKQAARAHEAQLAPELDTLAGMKDQHGLASRRQKAALARGDKAGAKEHGATVKDLAGQIKTHQNEVVAPIQKLIEHHNKTATKIAAQKIEALRLTKSESSLQRNEGESFGAAALRTHKEYFDPEVKEEFYPEASQHQLGMVAEGGGVTKTQATNLTAMSSAQRRWRNEDETTGIVTHPNLILAETFAAHHTALQSSGELASVEHAARSTATRDILMNRQAASEHQHQLDEAAGRPTHGPKPIKTEVTPAHVEQHVSDALAQHVASTYKAPAPLMGLAETHGRDMARLLNAKTPEEMSDVWTRTDSDKRPTFALALAAKHSSRAVRRQSAQAMTADTHRLKELGIDYSRLLGTTSATEGTQPGLSVTARQELPHQPGRSVQPGYNAVAMYGTRAALQMTAQRFKEGGNQAAVTPRYAQENPWGLFAAQNMADIVHSRRAKAAGNIGATRRESAAGYYTEQAKQAESRTAEFHKANPNIRRDQYRGVDEDIF